MIYAVREDVTVQVIWIWLYENIDESYDGSYKESCRLCLRAGFYYKGRFYLIMLPKFLSDSVTIHLILMVASSLGMHFWKCVGKFVCKAMLHLEQLDFVLGWRMWHFVRVFPFLGQLSKAEMRQLEWKIEIRITLRKKTYLIIKIVVRKIKKMSSTR